MPAVVSFDVTGPGLFVDVVDQGGDFELDLIEAYSEWKDWARTGSNLGFPPAFRQVADDPVSPTQNLVPKFFLNVEDGWKIRPADRDHQLSVVGDLFTDPAGVNPIEPRAGRTIAVQYFVSTTSAVKDADITQALKILEADQVFDMAASKLHYYERGTTTDLIPAKTIAGTSQTQNASATQ